MDNVNFSCLIFSLPSLDGLEPPMLDETWGLSNHTLNYKGRYSKQPLVSSTDDTTMELSKSLRQKFEQGSNFYIFLGVWVSFQSHYTYITVYYI